MRIRVALTVAVLVLLSRIASAAAPENLEYAVKATFLYKFAPFVEWPVSALQGGDSPFLLCVVGDDPVSSIIDQAAAGQRIGERTLIVRHLQMVTRNSGCHAIYVAGSPQQSPAAALNAVRGTPVLTVTDSTRSPGAPGIISFLIENGRVRFDIDAGAAAENHLVISSKLLSLARSVRPGP